MCFKRQMCVFERQMCDSDIEVSKTKDWRDKKVHSRGPNIPQPPCTFSSRQNINMLKGKCVFSKGTCVFSKDKCVFIKVKSKRHMCVLKQKCVFFKRQMCVCKKPNPCFIKRHMCVLKQKCVFQNVYLRPRLKGSGFRK